MEPISTSVITYVSIKFVDQFIIEKGFNKLQKLFFPSTKYQNRLTQLIYESIEEYENDNPNSTPFNKFPFYHSMIFFDNLNKIILLNNSHIDYNAIINILERNPNIAIPTVNELEKFYKILTSRINNDKKLNALFIDENYKSKIFELSKDLVRIESKVDDIFSKVKDILSEVVFHPSPNWYRDQCRSTIIDLSKRYTPELNIQLEISDIFEGLGRTEVFKRKVTKQFDLLIIKGKKILTKEFTIKGTTENLEFLFDRLYELFNNTNFLGTGQLPIKKLEELTNEIRSNVLIIQQYYLDEEKKLQDEKKEYRYYQKFGLELRSIREFQHMLQEFDAIIHGTTFQLANNPFLLLDGEAGIGKSHLIGDIVSNRIDNGYESIFLLGQHFVTDEDPWTQIFKRLRINSKVEDFLYKLNQSAEDSKKRIVLFLDAINEGRGNYFWNGSVKSFISLLKKYEWLGLVLTVRTSYKNYIFPEDEIAEMGLVEYSHYGFRNVEYEASKLFFNSFKIELPKVPLLHPEFQNPLFLKLFCEGINKAGLTRIPDGLQGITSIINFFIKNVNSILSKKSRIGYSESINLINKSINALIEYKIENQLRYIPYETAYQVVDQSIANFIMKKGFIDELIVEGVLSKNLFYNDENEYEEGVYLAYERFEDHLMAQYLLNLYPELEIAFKQDGALYRYVKDENAIYINKGLIDAFSIQVPEKTGQEFFMYISNLKDKYPIIESFVESLLWRKIETINEASNEYVNKYVFSYQGTFELFLETQIALTGVPDHFYNANSLHKYLMKFSLAERDANWTKFLKYRYNDSSSVKRLIEWAWSNTDKSHISDESLLLSCIALAWFHTSTNRKLRDFSTKALVCLLQNRLNVLKDLLKTFEGVNDPYIYERLYAVAYGCALRTSQIQMLPDLSEYIFNTIFKNSQEVVPHILLRDYARGVIEYAHYLNSNLNFDISKVRPPYKSNWPDEISTYEELEAKYDKDKYWHLWESVMGFGDFSRYIIGMNSNRSDWSGCKIGEIPIDREKLFEDFKKKLNEEQLNLLESLDPIITSDSSSSVMDMGNKKFIFKTAIGRKSEEKLNQIKIDFKKSLSINLLSEYEIELEPFLDHNHKIINTGKYFDLRIAQRIIFSRVIELGWSPELHLSFDKQIGTGRGRDTKPHERIGKKYQWIAYHEFMARLSDNFIKQERWGKGQQEKPYQGPWDPNVRDIDPTILISKTGRFDDEQSQKFWWDNNEVFDWDCSNEEWVNDSTGLPNFENILEVKDNTNEEWLILDGFPSWSEPKKIGEEKWNQPHKKLWGQIRSYIVSNDEFNVLKEWAIKQDFMGRWMPEPPSRYEMFNREYFWSPAQQYFMKEYCEATDSKEIQDKESGQYIATIYLTSQGFLWEEEYDMSKEETINFPKPSKLLFEKMSLKYSHNEGEFLSQTNEIQCFATNVYYNSQTYLIIKKKPFLKVLKENNLNLVWTFLGEKQIIGGHTFGRNNYGRLEISGAYYFENDLIKGQLNIKKQ